MNNLCSNCRHDEVCRHKTDYKDAANAAKTIYADIEVKCPKCKALYEDKLYLPSFMTKKKPLAAGR